MKYRMKTRGATYGAVSGRYRTWRSGQILDVPEGEFRHLSDGSCEPAEVETTSNPPKRETAAKVGLTKHAKGGGWWEVRRRGEVVFKKQSEEDVDEYIRENS